MIQDKEELRQSSLELLEKEKERGLTNQILNFFYLGVCYISRIPPNMQVSKLRELLDTYGVERIYLIPKSRKNEQDQRGKKNFEKRRSYNEGWVEFNNKKIAKMAALSLNGTKMSISLCNQFIFNDDSWQIKYLSGFKWENLTEKFNDERHEFKDKLKLEMQQAKKTHDFYQELYEEVQQKKIKRNQTEQK